MVAAPPPPNKRNRKLTSICCRRRKRRRRRPSIARRAHHNRRGPPSQTDQEVPLGVSRHEIPVANTHCLQTARIDDGTSPANPKQLYLDLD